MENWIILIIVVLVASLLQTSTGYGFSIIGVPFLLLIYPAHTAVQINIVLSICLSVVMIFKIAKEVDRLLLMKLIKGSTLGLVSGIFIYLYLDAQLLQVAVGGLILIVTILLMLKMTIRQTTAKDYVMGGISGLLTTSIGVPGPPLLLYFSGVGTNKTILRSTTLAYYLFVYSVSLIMMVSVSGTSKEVWISSFIALPSLFVGILLGQQLFKWVSQKMFRAITYVILISTGVYLVVS